MPLTATEEVEYLALLEQEYRARLVQDFYFFVKEAWPWIEPQPYVDGWHIAALCRHMEAVADRRIRNLLINISPRSSKSLVVSVCFPAWRWLTDSTERFFCTTYAEALSTYHAGLCLDLIQSEWYQGTFQPAWQLCGNPPSRERFRNTAGGYRIATSVGAKATGFGGSMILADDLHDINEDLSETRAEIDHAKQWWNAVMSSRVNDPKRSCKVMVGQRVAEDDVSGDLLKQETYDYLCIPAQYEPPGIGVPQSRTALGWTDPRTKPGEPMCPARYGKPELEQMALQLGFRFYAQFQQRPQSDATTLFRRSDWQRYDTMPAPEWFEILLMSWDMATKDEETSSYYAGHVWGKKGDQIVLVDRVWERMDFPEGVAAVEALAAKWPLCYGKLIEDKANGSPTLQVLRGKLFGLIAVNPQGQGSKRARAQAVAYIQRAKNAWVPSSTLRPWADEYIENMARLQWDDVDATSQAWSALMMPLPALDTARQEALQRHELQQKIHQAAHRDTRGASRSHV